MSSRKDLNSADLETVRASRSPTTVAPTIGEVLTKEDATVCVKELDLFVTVMLLEDTIRPKTNSNDFGRFGNYSADSNSNFVDVLHGRLHNPQSTLRSKRHSSS